jgi:hypothetical protein
MFDKYMVIIRGVCHLVIIKNNRNSIAVLPTYVPYVHMLLFTYIVINQILFDINASFLDYILCIIFLQVLLHYIYPRFFVVFLNFSLITSLMLRVFNVLNDNGNLIVPPCKAELQFYKKSKIFLLLEHFS